MSERFILPGTPQWFDARCGAFTASRAPALMKRTAKGAPTQAYHDLIGEIAAERLTGVSATHFVTAAMQRGLDLEPQAADAYALERMVGLGDSGLVIHPTLPRVAATPDRFVGDDGLLEIKCPSVQTKHLDTLRDGPKSVLHEYEWQCHFQMMCTGRGWVDLCSFFPEFPAHLQLAIVRVERDEDKVAQIEAEILKAEAAVSEILNALESVTTGQREDAA